MRGVLRRTPGELRRLCLASALVVSGFAAADTIEGQVIKVPDGDTIMVRDARDQQHEVRLAGIDAPEGGQPFGPASRQNLAALVLRKQVRVESDRVDDYGRALGKVRVQPPDCAACGLTLDANLAQLTAGMAWWYRHYANEQSAEDRERYGFAEQEARARRAGLWRDANPMAPWDWRHSGTTRAPAPTAATAAPDCNIKGNISARGDRIYHVPGQTHYAQTRISTGKGERWFCTEDAARAAGWRRARD